MTRKKPSETYGAPAHLSKAGAAFFVEMSTEYQLDGAGLKVLCRAAECLDRLKEAQSSIKSHGAVVSFKGKLSTNPACRLEKEARDGFLSAMRVLSLGRQKRRVGRPGYQGLGVSFAPFTDRGTANEDD